MSTEIKIRVLVPYINYAFEVEIESTSQLSVLK
jgi:hypothetical protein